MISFAITFGLGFAVGAVLVGVIAHRWPNLFAKAVTAANAVDAQVNAGVATVAAKVNPPAPPAPPAA